MHRRKIQKAIRRFFAAVLLSCGLICQQAGAAGLINGNITFAGSIALDTASAGTATMVTGWDGLAPGDEPQVESVDGNFATFVTPGDGLEFHAPWSFSSGAIPSFWSVDGFTFDLISSAIPSGGQTANSVFVGGMVRFRGMASIQHLQRSALARRIGRRMAYSHFLGRSRQCPSR